MVFLIQEVQTSPLLTEVASNFGCDCIRLQETDLKMSGELWLTSKAELFLFDSVWKPPPQLPRNGESEVQPASVLLYNIRATSKSSQLGSLSFVYIRWKNEVAFLLSLNEGALSALFPDNTSCCPTWTTVLTSHLQFLLDCALWRKWFWLVWNVPVKYHQSKTAHT